MPLAHDAPGLTPDELLRAAARLKGSELDQLLSRLLALRAQQHAPSVSSAETELLLRINAGLPADLATPYHDLIAKRRAATLTPAEYRELLRLTELVEARQAQRLGDLIELARLRGQTLDELMDTLGIQPPVHA
jgi:hypothetical protein